MKKQTVQNWTVSLKSLGIVFVLLLNTALACGGNNNSTSDANPTVLTTSSAALTEAIVKEIVTAKEKRVQERFKPEVTFESVRIGKTRKANKADEYDGIPAGATVYPVRVKYSVVLHTSTGPQTKNHHYDWDFFKDAHGEWATLGRGPVQAVNRVATFESSCVNG